MTNPLTKAADATTVVGMALCYALGNFTDNFFKQTAILMAAALALTDLQSLAALLFSLPFILCSAWAGWLADRLPKRGVVIASKCMELAALCLGAVALKSACWPGIMAVIFLMALQSTLFNPALNGAIPESFSEARVPRVNALIRLASTAAILAGVACAGLLLDVRGQAVLPLFGPLEGETLGRAVAGLFAVAVSLFGLLAAFGVRSKVRPDPTRRPFPWAGPLASLRDFLSCRRDPPLFTVMIADAFFYGLAAIALISIANMASGLGYSDSAASLLSAAIMTGIALGSLIAGRWPATIWRRLILPALTGMGCCMLLASLTPLLPAGPQFWWFAATLLAAGVWGGIYLIPIASFIQIRAGAGEKGKVLGAVNFASFTAMALCGAAFSLLGRLEPAHTFVVYGLLCLLFAHGFLGPRLRRMPDATLKEQAAGSLPGLLLRGMLALRYRVRELGLDRIPAYTDAIRDERPLLFLPNHPALIDPFIVYSRLAGLKPRPLSNEDRLRGPLGGFLVRLCGAVTIPDPARDRRNSLKLVREGLLRIRAALRQGDAVLLYPAGRLCRDGREDLGGNSAVAWLLREVPEVRVVLVRSTGLWGSAFSRADGRDPQFFRVLVRSLPMLLGRLILFAPKRDVTLEFYEAKDLPRDKTALNQRLEAYYNQKSAYFCK